MRSQLLKLPSFAMLTLTAQVSLAAENLQNVPEAAPPPPPSIEDGQAMEPEITIVQRKDATIEEYRLNNRLYMVKVTPFVGKPYYIVDKDGDGTMESKMSDVYNTPSVPQWVLFSW